MEEFYQIWWQINKQWCLNCIECNNSTLSKVDGAKLVPTLQLVPIKCAIFVTPWRSNHECMITLDYVGISYRIKAWHHVGWFENYWDDLRNFLNKWLIKNTVTSFALIEVVLYFMAQKNLFWVQSFCMTWIGFYRARPLKNHN